MSHSALHPIHQTTYGLVDPLGLGNSHPTLAWALSADVGAIVYGYQLQVASTADALQSGETLLWDTGEVASSETRVEYAGAPLTSRDRIAWRVRCLGGPAVGSGESGGPSTGSWSDVATAELGLLSESDWRADWITHPDWVEEPRPRVAPILGKSFVVSSAAGPVERARLYVSGLGVYVAEIDGEPVDDAVLEPGTSAFETRVAARAIDVTDVLQASGRRVRGPGDGEPTDDEPHENEPHENEHRLTVRLGEGSAHVRAAEGRYSKFVGSHGVPSALAALEIEYANGTTERIVTDESWLATGSPTVFTHWYGGEEYDSRLPKDPEPEAWSPVAVLRSATEGPAPWWRAAPPVRVVEVLAPVETSVASGPDATTLVFDFGVNLAGRPRIEVATALPAGSRLVLRPAELLGADGHVDQSTGGQPIFDVVTVGDDALSWAPEFCYHGFRYVELTGPAVLASSPGLVTMTAEILRVDDAEAGSFATSDARLERLDRLITQAVRSNLFWMPTDCPHREKLGWLEQLHLVFGPLAHRFDVRAHYRDVVTNMIDAQTPDGLIPDIAPELTVFDGGFRSDVNWGAAILEIPWRLFVAYGDTASLRAAWPAGERYLEYLSREAGSGLLEDHGLGDWIALDESTPRSLVAGFGYVHLLETAERIAGELGLPDAVEVYSERAIRHRGLLTRAFVDAATGASAGRDQSSQALVLDLGLIEPERRAAALSSLVATVRDDGYFTVGEVALPSLLRLLVEARAHELIHAIVVQTAQPGYGQMIDGDLTALAESWDNSEHPNSANHFMLGVIGDWLVGSVAGLTQAEGSSGWDRIRVAPALLDGLSSAATAYESRHGATSVGWSRTAERFTLTVTLPVGTSAVVEVPRLPGHALAIAPAGDHVATPDAFEFEVEHGEWRFETVLGGGQRGK